MNTNNMRAEQTPLWFHSSDALINEMLGVSNFKREWERSKYWKRGETVAERRREEKRGSVDFSFLVLEIVIKMHLMKKIWMLSGS